MYITTTFYNVFMKDCLKNFIVKLKTKINKLHVSEKKIYQSIYHTIMSPCIFSVQTQQECPYLSK